MSTATCRLLTIRTAPDQPGFVRVTVADTGPGVAPDVAAQLFKEFVSTKAEGMGLGLSICRTIVEANGCRIWREPEIGREHVGTPGTNAHLVGRHMQDKKKHNNSR